MRFMEPIMHRFLLIVSICFILCPAAVLAAPSRDPETGARVTFLGGSPPKTSTSGIKLYVPREVTPPPPAGSCPSRKDVLFIAPPELEPGSAGALPRVPSKSFVQENGRCTTFLPSVSPSSICVPDFDVSYREGGFRSIGRLQVRYGTAQDLSEVSSADASIDIAPVIEQEAKKHNLDPLLIKAIIRQESGFDPLALSPKGAGGLMQLMPETAAALGVSDIFNPWENIAAGVRYLRQQIDRFGSIALALAAYNAGPGAVEFYGGIPPFPETENYVTAILEAYQREKGDR